MSKKICPNCQGKMEYEFKEYRYICKCCGYVEWKESDSKHEEDYIQ